MNHISTDLAPWQERAAAAVTDPLRRDINQVMADADRAEMEAIYARQAANRAITYTRRRPSRYADAAYATLRPEQDPGGLITGWAERGPRTLLIAGPARTGKTTAAYAIGNDQHQAGKWVHVWTAAQLSADLKPDGPPLTYEYATRCDLLIIDDLGRERVTDWWLEQLHRVVDDRCSNERRLIVTTNAAASADGAYDELVSRYGDPVVERLIDGGGVVVLDGPAVRQVATTW